MQCCLLALGLAAPRLTIVLLVVFSDVIGRAFGGGVILPFVGFLFLPFTTLAYTLARTEHGAVEGLWVVLLVLAILADLGLLGGGHRARRRGRRRDAWD